MLLYSEDWITSGGLEVVEAMRETSCKAMTPGEGSLRHHLAAFDFGSHVQSFNLPKTSYERNVGTSVCARRNKIQVEVVVR